MQADNQGRVLLPVKLRQYVLGDARAKVDEAAQTVTVTLPAAPEEAQ